MLGFDDKENDNYKRMRKIGDEMHYHLKHLAVREHLSVYKQQLALCWVLSAIDKLLLEK